MSRSRQASDRAWQSTRKNLLINACFRVWQRGTSQTTTSFGSDDRWVNNHIGTTKTHSRQEFTVGQTDVPGNPRYYSRTVVSSVAGNGNLAIKYQPIEDCRITSGKTITLSFWAKADASKNIAMEWFRAYGSGGASSAETGADLDVETFSLTTSWQKFTATYTFPSVSGKTFGSDDNSWFAPVFWFDAGSDYDTRTNSLGQQSGTFDIAQVQVEIGDHATDFEQRDFGTELALCQRYFCKSYNDPMDPGTASEIGQVGGRANTQGWFGCTAAFPVAMRATPTVTLYNPVTGSTTNPIRYGTATAYNDTGNVWSVGRNYALVRGTNASTSYNSTISRFHYTADAEL